MGKLPTISLEITNQSRQHSLWMLVKAHRTNKGDWLNVLVYSGFLPNWYTPTQPVSSRLQNYVINFCLIAKQAYISYLITIWNYSICLFYTHLGEANKFPTCCLKSLCILMYPYETASMARHHGDIAICRWYIPYCSQFVIVFLPFNRSFCI